MGTHWRPARNGSSHLSHRSLGRDVHREMHRFDSLLGGENPTYPLVNLQKNYGKSPFLMGKLTINGHLQ